MYVAVLIGSLCVMHLFFTFMHYLVVILHDCGCSAHFGLLFCINGVNYFEVISNYASVHCTGREVVSGCWR